MLRALNRFPWALSTQNPSHGPFIWTGSHPQQAALWGTARKSHQVLIIVITIIIFYIYPREMRPNECAGSPLFSFREPPRDTCYGGTALIFHDDVLFSQSERTTDFLGAGWCLFGFEVSSRAGAAPVAVETPWFLLCGAVVLWEKLSICELV